ncbi:hypothetical protein CFBP2118_03610 [Pseudomonas syringae pv. syringae]|nr:hypothetical protein CFBP2118_03610 [Pseudomonas syringae pv. syringae]
MSVDWELHHAHLQYAALDLISSRASSLSQETIPRLSVEVRLHFQLDTKTFSDVGLYTARQT